MNACAGFPASIAAGAKPTAEPRVVDVTAEAGAPHNDTADTGAAFDHDDMDFLVVSCCVAH